MALPRLETPPGQPTPYIIPNFEGEVIQLPGSKGAIRILASSKETNGAISVFRMDGVGGDPVTFHYHNHAHDVFTCTKGAVQIWAEGKARELHPGDFAYVPPGIIHRPKLVDGWTETVGLVTPGDWIDFFRFISDPYHGIMADENDDRNPMASLGARIGAAKDKDFDVIMQPQYRACEVGAWDETDTSLPQGVAPYFLKANTGPCWLLGGVLSRPFITTKQNGGQFAISSIESSKIHGDSVFRRPISFPKIHHAFLVLDGRLVIRFGDHDHEIRTGETVFVPAGQSFAIFFPDKYVRFWSFASGDGIESLIHQGGDSFQGKLLPDQAGKVDDEKVRDAAAAIGAVFS